jgi:hypothetical protein
MSEQDFNCRRCKTAMVPGYIPDTSRKLCYQTMWYRGMPKDRIWRGKKYGIEDTKDGLLIIAYRCPDCGAMALRAPAAAKLPEQSNAKIPDEKSAEGAAEKAG